MQKVMELALYRKFPKYSDTQKHFCNHSKILTMGLSHRVMSPNDTDSVDPGSAMFAQAYQSENLGLLRKLRSQNNLRQTILCTGKLEAICS